MQQFFKRLPPNPKVAPQDQVWLPVIPLCGTAKITVEEPTREQMSEDNLQEVVDLAFKRIDGVKGLLLQNAPWIVKSLASVATWWIFSSQLKGKLKDKLRSSLGANIA